ncbi:PWWP domain-containing protein 3-like [Andrographis paniculata]|uniref:PWWP domain-containing protein 3-like n=1 Tax=Andrographis paniculata TaxID=175694 RepID=UPI0021E8DA99|nr:PWWP domain-containing protein 3-like [Andrographis paniculata]
MATLDDILAASKVLADNSSGNQNGDSGSKMEDNRNWVGDVKDNDGNAPAADTTKKMVEVETVVESIFDSNSCFDKTEKDKVVGNLNCVPTCGTSDDGIDVEVSDKRNENTEVVGGENIEDGQDTQEDSGQCRDSDDNQLDVTKRKSLNADTDGSEKGLVNGEKLGDLDHGFHVGDFVWAKIKSHPWWPGRVYDPRDASDFAMKRRQDGHLLVAFFGDGSCSWCLPSQLRPFMENFKEMSVGSNSKSFVNAVQRAVSEIGRVVESEMMCGCVPLAKRDGLARPLVTNAGIKTGILAPEIDVSRLSLPKYEPAEVLERVMELASTGNVDDVFELAVVRFWLSAFYRADGVYPLPTYSEPFLIEGMEDKNKTVSEVNDDFSVPIEVPILGPLEDDWLSNTAKPQASSGEKIYHRRKQKSVAELMGGNPIGKSKGQEETTAKERKDLGKFTSSKKKKKSTDGEVGDGRPQEGSSTGRVGRKRKAEASESLKHSLKKVSNTENSGSGNDASKGTSSGKPKKIEVVATENSSGESKEDTEIVSTPRERKKSKYLCPPYTTPIWRVGNQSFKMEATPEMADNVGEHTTEASADPFASASVSKLADKKVTEGHQEGRDASVKDIPETAGNTEKFSFAASDVNMPVDKLVSDIQSAALDPLYLTKEDCLDEVWSFVSALRSSIYLHGSNYKLHQKSKTGSKRKSVASQQGKQEKDVSHEKVKSGEKRNREEKKKDGKTGPSKSKSKKTTEVLDGNASSRLKSKKRSKGLDVNALPSKSKSKKTSEVLDENALASKSKSKKASEVLDENVSLSKLKSKKATEVLDENALASKSKSKKASEVLDENASPSKSKSKKATEVLDENASPSKSKSKKSTEGLDGNTSSKSKFKKAAEVLDGNASPSKSKAKKATVILDGNASPCLLLKFAPEYPLPSKEEIVSLFSKYGSLNKRATCVATDSHSVHVVYKNATDAEAAFKSSVNERPFGDKNVVDYQLQESSGTSKSHPKLTPRKRAAEKPVYPHSTSDDLLRDVQVIRQKLDIMTAILENYHSKFSAEDKSGLKQEMKNLLENVETASEKIRVLAENSPA